MEGEEESLKVSVFASLCQKFRQIEKKNAKTIAIAVMELAVMFMVLLRIVIFVSIMGLGLGNLSVEAQPLSPILLGQTSEDSEFTLPETVQNLTKQPGAAGSNSINFQTDLSLKEALDFYRQTLTEQGLKEREINTAITDKNFSIVFEGAKNGLAVVVQSVDLGELTNVNIRYEKLD